MESVAHIGIENEEVIVLRIGFLDLGADLVIELFSLLDVEGDHHIEADQILLFIVMEGVDIFDLRVLLNESVHTLAKLNRLRIIRGYSIDRDTA